jgi:nicotinate-nucleotide adenylyltransferase
LPPALGDRRPRRIGLLGGSFNPAHRGHLHVSLEALKRLKLDAVWWLVAPQNPLKPVKGMAPLQTRLAGARALARHPRIAVTDLEQRLGTRFTTDTLTELRRRFPRTHFVWLMGADNLAQIRHWERWREIFRLAAVAVFDRPTYCLGALAGLAAQRFKRRRRQPRDVRRLAAGDLPAWAFFPIRLDPSSATALRARRVRAAPTKTKR